MKTICIALAIICAFSTVSALDLKHQDLFASWKMRHNKEYETSLHEAVKYESFYTNYEFILDFNKENNGVQLALNQFADMSSEEFGAQFLGLEVGDIAEATKKFNDTIYDENGNKVTVSVSSNVNVEVNVNGNFLGEKQPQLGATNLGQVATSINWVTKGAVTSVKNQPCGNCWAYSAAGSIEGYNFVKYGKLLNLSPQQLTDCTTGCSGCNGCGGAYVALSYAAKNGIESMTDYPTTSTRGTCKYSSAKVAVKPTGYKNVATRSVSALKTALNIQPVTVAVRADQRVFQFYSSGVITANCGSSLNHAILAVGYQSVNGVDAFYVKNSWGTNWGINGYAYISASGTANSGYGVCGILSMISYPV